MTRPAVAHWQDYWARYRPASTTRATHLSICEGTLRLLRERYGGQLPAALRVLDLGCGDTSLTRSLVAAFARHGCAVEMIACDLVLPPTVVDQCTRGLALLRADASRLPLRDHCLDGVVSFGYASVASYRNPAIQRELARIIRPGGWLVADFRHHLSLWFLVLRPWYVVRWFARFLGLGKPQYHISTIGLHRYFAAFGLLLERVLPRLQFPPVRRLPPGLLLAVEHVGERLRLGWLTGRVFLACFGNLGEAVARTETAAVSARRSCG